MTTETLTDDQARALGLPVKGERVSSRVYESGEVLHGTVDCVMHNSDIASRYYFVWYKEDDKERYHCYEVRQESP